MLATRLSDSDSIYYISNITIITTPTMFTCGSHNLHVCLGGRHHCCPARDQCRTISGNGFHIWLLRRIHDSAGKVAGSE